MPFLSSISLLGIQVVYSFQYAMGTAFLLQAGLAPNETALVWLAGPIAGIYFVFLYSGILIQPLMGMWSDAIGKRYTFLSNHLLQKTFSFPWSRLRDVGTWTHGQPSRGNIT